jgi:O-antigen/teichoic acid export membrane protein
MAKPQILNQDGSRLVSFRCLSNASLMNVVYLAVQSLLFVVMTPLLLKTLGPKVYGLWTILAAIIGFANLGNFGIGAGVTKYVSEFSVSEKAGTQISAVISFSFLFLLLSGALMGMMIFFLSHWIATKMAHQASEVIQLANALGIISWGIALVFLMQLPKSILFGLVYHKVVGAIDLAQGIIIFSAALIIGLRGGGIVALALSLMLINLTFLLILFFVAFHVTRSFGLRFTLNRDLTRKLFQYSLFAWISSLGSILFSQADRVLVGILLGPVAAGAYSICTGVAARLHSLSGSVTQALIPFASSYRAAGKNTEIAKVFLHLLRLVGCLLAAVGIGLILWSTSILSIWISPQFSINYGKSFQILILAYAIYAMAAPGNQIAFGLGHPKMVGLATIGSGLLMLLLIWFLSSPLGLTGVGLANTSTFLMLWVSLFTAKLIGLPNMKSAIRAALPSVAMLLLTILINNLSNLTFPYKLIINLSFLSILTWLALNDNRLKIVLRAIKSDPIGSV